MRAEKIREMSPDDLRGKEKELRERLFRLRLQKSIGQLSDGLKIRETRREIAQIKTILNEKTSGARAGARTQ